MKIKPGDSRELSKSSETETEVSTGTILIDQDYHIIVRPAAHVSNR